MDWSTKCAYHESGHAYANYAQGFQNEFATIIPEVGNDGHCKPAYGGPDGLGFRMRMLIADLSGFAAYRLIDPSPSAGERDRQAGADDPVAGHDACRFVAYFRNPGLLPLALSSQLTLTLYLENNAAEIHRLGKRILAYCEGLAFDLVSTGQAAVAALASELMEHKRLSGADVERVIKQYMPGFEPLSEPHILRPNEEREIRALLTQGIGFTGLAGVAP